MNFPSIIFSLFCCAPPQKYNDDDNVDNNWNELRCQIYILWIIFAFHFFSFLCEIDWLICEVSCSFFSAKHWMLPPKRRIIKEKFPYVSLEPKRKSDCWLISQIFFFSLYKCTHNCVCLRADTINPLGMRAMCCYWFINNCLINYSIKQ